MGLIQNLDEMDAYHSFYQPFSSNFADSTCNFLGVTYINLTQFCPQPHQSRNGNIFKLNKLKIFDNIWNLMNVGGGLAERGLI